MSYSRGMLRERITVWKPTTKTSQYGKNGVEYEKGRTVWAAVTFQRGARALRNAEINMSGTVLVRCDIFTFLTRRCRLEWKGKYYIIDSFETDEHEDICQIMAHEIEDIQEKANS